MARSVGNTAGYAGPTVADYYIAPGGSDLNDGSITTPWATPEKAAQVLDGTAGGTVALRGGKYRQGLSLNGRTYSSLIHFHRYGTEVPVLSGAEVLSGFVACDSGDSDNLGAAWPDCYKADIPSSDLVAGIPAAALNIHENGVPLPLAFDKASSEDDFFTRDVHNFHTADNFNDVGGTITQIQDSSVFGAYTSAQLVNAQAIVYRSGNWADLQEITAYNGSDTITINATSDARYADPSMWLYGLQNIGPAIQQGQWCYKKTLNGDGSRTIYIYPNNPANLTSGIEFSKRQYGIDTGDCDNVMIDGLVAQQQAGNSNASCVGFGGMTNTAAAKSNITIKECLVQGLCADGLAYGGIFYNNASDLSVTHNEIKDHKNVNAMIFQGCDNVDYSNNYIYRCSTNPMRIFGVTNSQFTFNKTEFCGRDAHSNKFAIYLQSDTILVYANEWADCMGYGTHQEASNIYYGFNKMPADTRPAYGTVAAGNYGFYDQNGSSVPDASGYIDCWNNFYPPNPDRLDANGGSYVLGNNGNSLSVSYVNNVSNGGGDITTAKGNTLLDRNNLLTYRAWWQYPAYPTQVPDASDTIDETLSNTYTDAPNGDFTPAPGGNMYTLAGFNFSSSIAARAAVDFPSFDFNQDFNGDSFVWTAAPVGHLTLAESPNFAAVPGVVNFQGAIATVTGIDAYVETYSSWNATDYEYLGHDAAPLSGATTTGTGFIYYDIDFGATQVADSTPYVTFDADFSRYNVTFISDSDNETLGFYLEDSAGNFITGGDTTLVVAGGRHRIIVRYEPTRVRLYADGNATPIYDTGVITATTWKFNTAEWYLMGGIVGDLYHIGFWESAIDPTLTATWENFYNTSTGEAKNPAIARNVYGDPIFQMAGPDYIVKGETNDLSTRGNNFFYDGPNVFIDVVPGQLGFEGEIQTLQITNNSFFDAAPGEVGFQGEIASLFIANNQFFDAVSGQVPFAGEIATLALSGNKNFDAVPGEASFAGAVQSLAITDNLNFPAVPGELPFQGEISTLAVSDHKNFPAIAGEVPFSGAVQALAITNNINFDAVPGIVSFQGAIAEINIPTSQFFEAVPGIAAFQGEVSDLAISDNKAFEAVPGIANFQGEISVLDISANKNFAAVPGIVNFSGSVANVETTQNKNFDALPGIVNFAGTVQSLSISDNKEFVAVPGIATFQGEIAAINISNNSYFSAVAGLFEFRGTVATLGLTNVVLPSFDAGVLYAVDYEVDLYARF